ncbi:MAG TPA: S41 family peptidase [Blastocatellia bacterium]|nr:S41 family peptidase [Blastocatellia bacterium]
MKKVGFIIFLCLAVAPLATSQTTSGALWQETFDVVWRTVKEKHYDPKFNGVDWDKVRAAYHPRVSEVKSEQELYALLQQMIGELGQSHFNIIPREALVEDKKEEPSSGTIGVEVKHVDDLALITQVEENSPAARAGLRAGFAVKQIDQTPVDQIVERLSKSKRSPELTRLLISRSVAARLNGRPQTSVRVTYLDERDQAREIVVERVPVRGEMSQPLGNFPGQYPEFEAKRLPSGIGYIRFNVFAISLMEKVRQAIRSMSDAPGIIIDLRGNPGGVGVMANGMAGLLHSKQASLGTMRLRTGHMNFAVFPQPEPYPGPVAILIDNGSASTSEIFAAGMQELGRAVVVGERSAGAALPSVFLKLPTGALFQYAVADFKTPKGVLIEGRGVQPDIEVKLNRRELLGGHDSQLDRAVEQIQKKIVGSRQ